MQQNTCWSAGGVYFLRARRADRGVEWEERVGDGSLQFSIFSSLVGFCRWDQEVLLLLEGFKHARAETLRASEMSFFAGGIQTRIL